MTEILSYFVRLCLFRNGPQDAPGTEQALVAAGALTAISHALTNNTYDTLTTRMIIAVAQVVVFGAVVWLVLKVKNLEPRWRQTLTALFGAAALFQFVSWPLIASFDPGAEATSGLPEPLWLHVVIGVWYLAVMAHIFRHALETSIGRGLAAAVFCQLTTLFGLLVTLSLIGVGESGY